MVSAVRKNAARQFGAHASNIERRRRKPTITDRIAALRRRLAALQQAHDDEPDLAIANATAEQMYAASGRLAELKIEQRRKLGALATRTPTA